MRGTRKSTAKARHLRGNLTRPEARLWQILRQRPDGLKSRRQHPVGPYVLDFYCPSAKVGIEVDGNAHDMGDNPRRDEVRDSWLTERGYRILRIPARELYGDIEPAVLLILTACRAGPSTALRAVPLPTACGRREDGTSIVDPLP